MIATSSRVDIFIEDIPYLIAVLENIVEKGLEVPEPQSPYPEITAEDCGLDSKSKHFYSLDRQILCELMFLDFVFVQLSDNFKLITVNIPMFRVNNSWDINWPHNALNR